MLKYPNFMLLLQKYLERFYSLGVVVFFVT